MAFVKAIFLDVGGTLLEMGDPARAYQGILQQHGFPATIEQVQQWLREARQATRQRPRDPAPDHAVSARRERARRMAQVDAFLTRAGVRRESDLQACRAAIYQSWTGGEVFRLYPETPHVLTELKQQGFLLGTVSNWEPRLAELCENLGIARYFDFILASEAEGYAKPSRHLFERALEQANVQPAEAIHVGDSLIEDVQAAESLGIQGVLIQRGAERRADYTPCIPSLESLLPLVRAAVWLRGRVIKGKGEAAGFTQLEWVRQQLQRHFGFEPYPGTLNLVLEGPDDRAAWSSLQETEGYRLEPAPGFCAARCYPVTVEGQFPGAIVLPEVEGYPADVVEVVSPTALRASLRLGDTSRLTLAVAGR